jgi:cell division protein ZipA
MGELRAILLGIAVCLLAVIWWWTARNSRQARGGAQTDRVHPGGAPSPAAADPEAGAARTGAVHTGAMHTGAMYTEVPRTEAATPDADSEEFPVQQPSGDFSNRDWGVSPLEPLSIKTADFDRVPILEMPMMVDVKTPSGLDDETVGFAHEPPPPVLTQVAEPAPRGVPKASPSPQRPAAPQARTDDSDRFAPPAPRSPNASEQQRIVTIRVCAVGEGRWSGGQLMAALESQGLAYGKYKVYHRRHVDGRSLFCVASLIEPGTFDVELMPQQEFRGLTLFAVLPGPAEPLQTIDALLTTARGLAENLTAMVQDAQGLPLSPLRAAALREDIARFQAQLA